MPAILQLVACGRLDPTALVERRVGLEEGARAIEAMDKASPLGITMGAAEGVNSWCTHLPHLGTCPVSQLLYTLAATLSTDLLANLLCPCFSLALLPAVVLAIVFLRSHLSALSLPSNHHNRRVLLPCPPIGRHVRHDHFAPVALRVPEVRGHELSVRGLSERLIPGRHHLGGEATVGEGHAGETARPQHAMDLAEELKRRGHVVDAEREGDHVKTRVLVPGVAALACGVAGPKCVGLQPAAHRDAACVVVRQCRLCVRVTVRARVRVRVSGVARQRRFLVEVLHAPLRLARVGRELKRVEAERDAPPPAP
eukprot:scaffold68735_cov66-Phaeocystis_antarctica.AAC.3